MITFIISVKHYENSHSYGTTWKLLENTLASVCNQSNDNFNVIVISNKTLDAFKGNPKIKNVKFLELNWAPPATRDSWQIGNQITGEVGMDQIRIDRGTKHTLGLNEVLKAKSDKNHYVMFVDADDFIHRDLVKYIYENTCIDFFRIKKGYKLGKDYTYEKMNNFSNVCGTSNITRIDLLSKNLNLQDITLNSTQGKILQTTDDYYLKMILGSHKFSYQYFKELGHTGQAINFPAAIYNCSHSEQHSGKDNIQFQHKLTDSMKEDFSVKYLGFVN